MIRGHLSFFSLALILVQSIVYYQFRHYLKSKKFYKKSYSWYALIPFIVFNVPFIIISSFGHGNYDPPEWFKTYLMPFFYVWLSATILIAVWLIIGKLIKLPFLISVTLLKLVKPIKKWILHIKEKKPVRVVDLSRRKFIRGTTFALSSYAFLGSGYGVIVRNNFQIDYKKIRIENLPNEFRGLTVTLLSDIHAGEFMDEYDMMKYCDAVNELGSDVICMPGDFVNFLSVDSKMVAKAFGSLKAKYGVWGSLGNHDFFQNPDYVTAVLNNESPIKVMRNSYDKITINGKSLYILGIDDTRSSGAEMNAVVLNYLDTLSKGLTNQFEDYPSSPKILLCHKPYGFDDLAKREIDLVLSGHTHGGQVVPVKFGRFSLSFAALVSKYIEGYYAIGKSNMYVSRGIGTVAVPIRINCPPELTKITLV
jgi:predicted MPP superfamily phosphohydrolase